MNSAEDLFFEIYSSLKDRFDISDEILKYISLQLPHSFNDLYMVPSFGPSTLKEKGQQIIDITFYTFFLRASPLFVFACVIS